MPSYPPEPSAGSATALPSTASPLASREIANTPPLGAFDSAVISSCLVNGSQVMPSIVGKAAPLASTSEMRVTRLAGSVSSRLTRVT